MINFLLLSFCSISESSQSVTIADCRPVQWSLSINNAQNKNKGVYVLDTFFIFFFRGRMPPNIPTPPPPSSPYPVPRKVMAERGITLDGYVVEHFTLYQKSNLRALSKAFFILPYLNVVSWNIFQLGGPFWGLVVVKLSQLIYATMKIPTHSRRKQTLPAEVQ